MSKKLVFQDSCSIFKNQIIQIRNDEARFFCKQTVTKYF